MSGIDRLRRLADEPAGDEWYASNDLADVLRDSYGWVGGPSPAADAAWIAAMNPEVGRALLDVVEAARGAVADVERSDEVWGLPDLEEAIARLDALLDEQDQA